MFSATFSSHVCMCCPGVSPPCTTSTHGVRKCLWAWYNWYGCFHGGKSLTGHDWDLQRNESSGPRRLRPNGRRKSTRFVVGLPVCDSAWLIASFSTPLLIWYELFVRISKPEPRTHPQHRLLSVVSTIWFECMKIMGPPKRVGRSRSRPWPIAVGFIDEVVLLLWW